MLLFNSNVALEALLALLVRTLALFPGPAQLFGVCGPGTTVQKCQLLTVWLHV